jgi:hypothetical protein
MFCAALFVAQSYFYRHSISKSPCQSIVTRAVPHESLLLERQSYELVQHTTHVTFVLSIISGTQINGRRVNKDRECGCRG